MKSFGRKRRALSTVVTAALMLSAVVVLGGTMVAWSKSSLITNELSLSSSSSSKTNKITESLSIENAWFCSSSCPLSGSKNIQGINVTLTNVGTIGLNVTQITVNGSSYVYPITKGALLPGQSFYFFTSNVPWQKQKPDTISATTARGSIFTTQVTP